MLPISCPAFSKPLPEVVDCPLHNFSINVGNFFGYGMLEFIQYLRSIYINSRLQVAPQEIVTDG